MRVPDDSQAACPERGLQETGMPSSRSSPSSGAARPCLVRGVRISHPGRVVDAQSGATKLDVVRYHELIAPRLLPQLKGRPVSLLRAPQGVEGERFFQKHRGRLKIAGLRELDPALDAPHPPLLTIDTAGALVGAAQMGVLEFHPWGALHTSLERPDRVVFDLDPGEDLAWAQVLEAAELTKTLLDDLGLHSFLKTSGGKGLHIVVPLQRRHDWATCRRFAESVARQLAAASPDRFSDRMGRRHRVGKVFVDYLRNQRGATAVAAYSLRARPGLGISVPVAWEELVELKGGDHWRLSNIERRLADLGPDDPWSTYEGCRQRLTQALRLLDDDEAIPAAVLEGAGVAPTAGRPPPPGRRAAGSHR